MTRGEFVKLCSLFGVALPFQNLLSACKREDDLPEPFSGKVLIIGAGAGGLSAGYFLHQQGTDFEILEASSFHGGRMRIDTGFADFPIPLGAEWLEAKPSVFRKIINDSTVPVDIPTVADRPDRKFVNYSWFQFFEDYIVPSVSKKISYNAIVQSIDYSGAQIVVTTQNGQFTADKVVVAVPLKILKDQDIHFFPALPEEKRDAIENTIIWDGFKAFFEFSSRFYGEEFPLIDNKDGQKIYYDASFGQNTNKNILGLFAVGTPAKDFISRSGDDLKNFILDELDDYYNQQARPRYLGHITQNWNEEPFIKAGYMTDYADWRLVRQLGNPVGDQLYFAGGEYTDGSDWVSVHTAALSAKRVIAEMNG